VVVVDNGSGDRTRKAVEGAVRDYPDHKIKCPGLLSGRHRGVLETESGLIAFVDDDVDVAPEWLPSILHGFSDPHVHLVGGVFSPATKVLHPPG
jgi:glycosyltransferase involved in cell wall biosynthesis